MAVKTFLGRLVVVRIDRQPSSGADLFGKAVKLDRFAGRVRPHAGNYRDTAGGEFDGQFDDALMFGMIKRRRFAGGPDWNQTINSVFYLELDLFA